MPEQSGALEFAALGGDDRQAYAVRTLRKLGYPVRTWGVPGERDVPLREALLANAVLLPLPATADGVCISAPAACVERLRFSTVLNVLAQTGGVLLGGRLPQDWRSAAEARGVLAVDYAADERFQTANAVPTAEGALLLALEALPCTLNGTTVVVTGYGRIGARLAALLRGMGAKTLVLARRADALFSAKAQGHATVRLRENEPILLPADCRAVFNTIPYPIFDEPSVAAFPRACRYIELASLPGGIDLRAAGAHGISVIHGGGLPGRYFPESAGQIVAETVLRRLLEEQKQEGTP